MPFLSIGSGSRGTATLVEAGGTRGLMDCGRGSVEPERRQVAVGVEPASVRALVLTDEHADRVRGVAAFAARQRATVWTTPGTWTGAGAPQVDALRLFCPHAAFRIGCPRLQTYPVRHDAREPARLSLEGRGRRLRMRTDARRETPHAWALADWVAPRLELDHHPHMLASGHNPAVSKRWISGT